jgi:hypothetical protein
MGLGSRPEVSERCSGVSQQSRQQQQSPFCSRAGVSAVPARFRRIASSNQCARIIQAGIRAFRTSGHVVVGAAWASRVVCNSSLCATAVCDFMQQCRFVRVCDRAVAPQARVCIVQHLARPSRRRRAATVQCAGVHLRPTAIADFMQQSRVCATVQCSWVCPRNDRKLKACVARHSTSRREGMGQEHPRASENGQGGGRDGDARHAYRSTQREEVH